MKEERTQGSESLNRVAFVDKNVNHQIVNSRKSVDANMNVNAKQIRCSSEMFQIL